MRAIRAEGRDVVLGPFPYFFQQTLLVNPLTAPIWLAGLFALLFSMRLKALPRAGLVLSGLLHGLLRAPRQRTTTWLRFIRCCWPPALW